VEPETALRKANDKFTRRFTAMEHAIEATSRTLAQMSLGELEAQWQIAKEGFSHEDTKTRRSSKEGISHEDTKTRRSS
jgi:hypothetical protein